VKVSHWSQYDGVPGFAVYRLFDAAGVLLYIGATKNVKARMYGHGQDKPWWPEVVKTATRVEWFESVEDAARAEHEAILSERPVHNRAGRPGQKPQRYRIPPGVSPRHGQDRAAISADVDEMQRLGIDEWERRQAIA
jgi:predicted GIY-YIG superfamily endonuclease